MPHTSHSFCTLRPQRPSFNRDVREYGKGFKEKRSFSNRSSTALDADFFGHASAACPLPDHLPRHLLTTNTQAVFPTGSEPWTGGGCDAFHVDPSCAVFPDGPSPAESSSPSRDTGSSFPIVHPWMCSDATANRQRRSRGLPAPREAFLARSSVQTYTPEAASLPPQTCRFGVSTHPHAWTVPTSYSGACALPPDSRPDEALAEEPFARAPSGGGLRRSFRAASLPPLATTLDAVSPRRHRGSEAGCADASRVAQHSSGFPRRCRGDCSCAQSDSRKTCTTAVDSRGRKGCLHAQGAKKAQQQQKRRRRREAAAERERDPLQGHGGEPSRRSAAWRTTRNPRDALSPASTLSSNSDLANREREADQHTGREGPTLFERKKREVSNENSDPRTNADARSGHTRKEADRRRRQGERRDMDRRHSPRRSSSSTAMLRHPPSSDPATQGRLHWGTSRHPQKQKDPLFHAHRLSAGRRREFQVDPFESPREDVEGSENASPSCFCSPRDAGEATARPLSRQRPRVDAKSARTQADRDLKESTHLNERRRVGELKRPSRLSASEEEPADLSTSSGDSRFGVPNPQIAQNEVWPSPTRREETPSVWTPALVPGGQQLLWQQTTRRLTVEEEQAVACFSGNCEERRGPLTDESPELGCLANAPDAVCPQCHAVQDLQRTGSFPPAPHMSAGPSLLFEGSARRPTTSFVPEAGVRDPDRRRSNFLSSDRKRLPPLERGCCVTPDAQSPGDLVQLLLEKEHCMRGLERQLSALQVEHRTLLALADGSSLRSACLRVPEDNNEGRREEGIFLNARSLSEPREQLPHASFTALTSFRDIRGKTRKDAPVHCPYSDEKVFPGVHVSSHTPSSAYAFPGVEKPFQKPFFFPPLDAEEEKRVRGEAARAALGFPSFSPYQRVYGSLENDQRKGCAQDFEQKMCFREEKHRDFTHHQPPGHIQERNLSHRAAHPARFPRLTTAPAALGESFPTPLSPVSESDGEESRDSVAYPGRRRCRTHSFAEGSLHAHQIADAGNPNGGEALYGHDPRRGETRFSSALFSSASKCRDKCAIPYLDASRPDATSQGRGRERSRKEETEGFEGRWQREKEARRVQAARGGLEAWERHPEKKTTNSNVSGSAAVDCHSRESQEEQRRHPVARAAVEVLRKAKERRGEAARTTLSSQVVRENILARESDRQDLPDGRGDGEDVERRTEKESRKGKGREKRQNCFSVELRESPQMHRRRASLAGEERREAGDIGEESEAGPHAELEVEADAVEKKSKKTRRTRQRPVKKKAEPEDRKKTQADPEEDEGEAARAALSRRTRTKVEKDGEETREETRGKAKEKTTGSARARRDTSGSVAAEGAPQPCGPLRRSPRLEGQEQRRQEREAEQEHVEKHATETEGQATDTLGSRESPEDALDDLFSFDSPSPECDPTVSSSPPAGSGRRKASRTEKNKKRREVAASTESPRGRRSRRESRKTRERENLLLSLSPATRAPASVSRRGADAVVATRCASSVAPARFPLSSADSSGVTEKSRLFSSLEEAASSPSAAREQGGEKERSSSTTANATKLSPLPPSEKPRSERALKDSKENASGSAGRPRQKRSRTTSVLGREEKRPTLVHDAETLQRLRREELETIPSPIVTRIRLGLFDRLSLMKKTDAGDKESDRKPAARAGAREGSRNQLDSEERTPRRHSTPKKTQAEPSPEAFRGQRRQGDKEGRKEESAGGSKLGGNEGGTRVPLASTAARNEKAEARGGVEDEEGGGEEESAQPGEAFAGGSVKKRGASGSSRESKDSPETLATTPSWRAAEDGVQAGDRLGGRVVRRGTDVRNRAFSSTLLRLINGDMRVTTEKDVHLFITNYCLEKGLSQLRSVANGKKVKKWPIGKDPLLRVLFGEAANTFPASKAEMMETLRKNKHISYFSIA
ncbi:UNVERIFIED_CONTAM: hypothetical protein HHA_205640 [Hammondia hammondi]|eukprot:XP_008886047.1 hypothetical protein HHA_205640 [Hammondia hammondi]